MKHFQVGDVPQIGRRKLEFDENASVVKVTIQTVAATKAVVKQLDRLVGLEAAKAFSNGDVLGIVEVGNADYILVQLPKKAVLVKRNQIRWDYTQGLDRIVLL